MAAKARAIWCSKRNIGPVPCHVTPAESAAASFDLPALPSEAGRAALRGDVLAAALGLTDDDIGFGNFAPSCWSAGIAFAFVPLKNLDAVRRAKPDLVRFAAFDCPRVFVFANETAEPGHDFHARMFAPSFGIGEDPATGSAAAAFAGVLHRFAGLKDGIHGLRDRAGL